MQYPGKELEIFDNATIWRKYVHNLTKKYFKDNFLEVGAGIGSFTKNYFANFENIEKLSPDLFSALFVI